MRRRRQSEGFNLAFLDIMACGLGAVVLIFMLVKNHVSTAETEPELLKEDIVRLEMIEQELQQSLAQFKDISQAESEKIAQLQAQIASLEQKLQSKGLSLSDKKQQLAALKSSIKNAPKAQKTDPIEDDRGGEENYLIGLKVEGKRIVILLDSSASMTDEHLLDIIKRKTGSDTTKQAGPKWQRSKRIVRWILARAPVDSQVAIVSYNEHTQLLGGGYINPGQQADTSRTLSELNTLVPQQATNLHKGLQEAKRLKPTDIYVITDGLPTKGESRYGSLNPFSQCSSLLGTSDVISGECRVKLFRQSLKDSAVAGITANVILLPLEGDPDASNEYWAWTASSGGLLLSPASNWP